MNANYTYGNPVIADLLYHIQKDYLECHPLIRKNALITILPYTAFKNFEEEFEPLIQIKQELDTSLFYGGLFSELIYSWIKSPKRKKYANGLNGLKHHIQKEVYFFSIETAVSVYLNESFIGNYKIEEIDFKPIDYNTSAYVYHITAGNVDLEVCYVAANLSLPVIQFKKIVQKEGEDES